MIRNLAKKKAFVNHYSFHIMDPTWGHVTIKMSGHPPFGAQVILNGHQYALARVADTLSQQATIGRLSQVCDRWIYSACLLFGLDLDDQQRSGFRYSYSVYQVEYSRNLLFRVGARWSGSSTPWSTAPVAASTSPPCARQRPVAASAS